MSDLISRQAAIDALMKRDKELRNINWYDKPFAEGECKGIDYALEIVNALPSVQPTQSNAHNALKTLDCIDRQAAIDKLDPLFESLAIDKIKALPTAQPEKRTETHACDCISREDVEQTVEDNILCYTHSDRPIDQDPDTECHKAIRIALGMLRKDLRKLPSAQPEIIHCGDCKYQDENWRRVSVRWLPCMEVRTGSNWYCGSAERRTDERSD